MTKPNLPHQLIIPLLIQEKLMVPPERRIRLAVTVQERRVREAATRWLVQEEHHTLANVDEDADSSATLLHVLPAAAALAGVSSFHAAGCLGAEDGGAEKADRGVGDFLAGRGTLAFDGFFREGVVVLGQTNEFEDRGVRKLDVDGVRLVLDGSVDLSEPAVGECLEVRASGCLGGV